LKGLFLQTKDIYTIGRVTKLEAVNRKIKFEYFKIYFLSFRLFGL